MNTSIKDRLLQLFQKENIPVLDRDFWFSRLENAPEAAAEHIVRMFEEFPSHINWFRGIQERKEIALAANDTIAWEDIIEAEKKYLEIVAASLL